MDPAIAPEVSVDSTPAASTSQIPPPPPVREKRKAPAPHVPGPNNGTIQQGHNVLIRLPSAIIKPVVISLTGKIVLGKYGTFMAKDLIGRPYGDTYEIKDGGLSVVKATLNEIEETAANNENISSAGAQKLTFFDIETLRSEGLSGREIIQRQVEEHSAFELKTEYSKEKYMKRKEAKYLQLFTPIEPTVHNVCLYNFEKQASKIRDLRPDTLSQIMGMANVRPGGRLLVVEDVHGMVVAAAVERMGGEGRILVINDADSPPDLHLLETFNFTPAELEPIVSIHWAATEESYVAPALPMEVPEDTPKNKNAREQIKIKRRKAVFDKTQQTKEEYFAGGFDGVIIASEYEPFSILEKILPSIAGSAPVVIYSPFLQVLHDCQSRLRSIPELLAPSIVEPWLRKYQVLPGRTHPEMAGMGHGGYILATTRVFNDAEANSVSMGRRQVRRRKVEADQLKAEQDAAGAAEVAAAPAVAAVVE